MKFVAVYALALHAVLLSRRVAATAGEERSCSAKDNQTVRKVSPGPSWGSDAPRPPAYYDDHTPVTGRTEHSFDHFLVSGVNLARYVYDPDRKPQRATSPANPFELYDSFDISDQIRGDESWWDLIRYRQLLQRPTNSFYSDKVALKRWLPSIGLAAPETFALLYGSEISSTGQFPDELLAIQKLLPDKVDFAAKPSHMSFTDGVWLVNYDANKNVTNVSSREAQALKEVHSFNPNSVAASLAIHLHKKPLDYESWTLYNVKPGIVIEERFSSADCPLCPPIEFNVFVIWGRTWLTEINFVTSKGRSKAGCVHRNGTTVAGGMNDHLLEDWLHWLDYPRVVQMAEKLGAHKDMLRVDIFVGVASGLTQRQLTESIAERWNDLKYVISEVSFHTTTQFENPKVREEGARLWIAGYKMGNYKIVPNTEVPQIFKETGMFPASGIQETRIEM